MYWTRSARFLYIPEFVTSHAVIILPLHFQGYKASEVKAIIGTHYKETAENSDSTIESPYKLEASSYKSQHLSKKKVF